MTNAIWNPEDIVAISVSDCSNPAICKLDLHTRYGTVITLYEPTSKYETEGLEKIIQQGYYNGCKDIPKFDSSFKLTRK